MAEKQKEGHRQRLRERFLKGEDGVFSEETLLEILLTYAIPQKDVQPTAKQMIHSLGSLSAVLNSSVETLCKFDGIKENTAVLIKLADRIRRHPDDKESAGEPVQEETQISIFDLLPQKEEAQKVPSKAKPQRRKSITRRGTELFGKAVLKEAIQMLPLLPDTESLDEMRAFLRANLHFSAEQTRQRNANYITRRLFPGGYADKPLRLFGKAFPGTQDLREVCFYRFLKAEPLEAEIIEAILLPNLGSGRLGRERIRKFLIEKFPAAGSIGDCAKAAVDAMTAAGIAKADRTKILFSYRDIPIRSFAFILHSEFPEPGMYDIGKAEENRFIRAMLWNPERLLPSLYELRNRGWISKLSEIDSVRQFSTRYTLSEAVERLVAGGKKA
jgi:DNA repair protein RadC